MKTFYIKFPLLKCGHPSNSSDLAFIFSLLMNACCDWSLVEKLKNGRKIFKQHFLISVMKKCTEQS